VLKRNIRNLLIKLGIFGPIFRAREIVTAVRSPIRETHGPDGLPLPGAYLRMLVAGTPDPKWFLDSGLRDLTRLVELVNRSGGDFRSFHAVLDFGCGCGRVARHLAKITNAQICGSDYNPRLVRWCQENLPGHFSQNRLRPPLPFEDKSFDCIYALSVFTHLREDTQFEWLTELRRVLRLGGYLIVSFQDEGYINEPRVKKLLSNHGFLIQNNLLEGSNLMATYHTHEYIKKRFAEYFRVLETVQGDGPRLALALLRKE